MYIHTCMYMHIYVYTYIYTYISHCVFKEEHVTKKCIF